MNISQLPYNGAHVIALGSAIGVNFNGRLEIGNEQSTNQRGVSQVF